MVKENSSLRSILRTSPTVVQLHGPTMGTCGTHYSRFTAVLLLETYEDNGPTVEYLLPVCSKCNAIFLHTIFLTTELI